MHPLLRQTFVVSGAALNIAGHGCAHGYPAVLFAQLGHNSTDRILTEHDMSWITSISSTTTLPVIFLTPPLIAFYGKRKTHMISTIPAILGWMMFAFTGSLPLFLAARLMHGVSFGVRLPLSPALVAEYTDPKYRGAFIGSFAACLGIGIFLSHLWGTLFNYKITSLACGVFPSISLIIIYFSPESPSWLITKGKFDKASESFRWLRGTNAENEKELTVMINLQRENLERNFEERNDTANNKILSWKKINVIIFSLKVFKKGELLKPTLVAMNMLIIFEYCGNHFIPAYGHMILMKVLDKNHVNDVNWHLTTLGILRMICAVVAIFLLKIFRRRIILFTSGFLTVASMISISSFMYARKSYGEILTPFEDILPICLLIIYVLSFCLGLAPINWVICGEIFPIAHRNLGTTMSVAFISIIFMICLKTTPHLFVDIGVEGTFLCYSLILTVCMLVMYKMLPETKNKTLHEIESSFLNRGKSKETDKGIEMR